MERKEFHSTGRKMDYSDIDTRFEPYFDSGERVEVTWKDGFEDYSGYGARTNGKKSRFYVGKSTGWKPIFIQILTKRSFGGVGILSCAVDSIHGINTYRR